MSTPYNPYDLYILYKSLPEVTLSMSSLYPVSSLFQRTTASPSAVTLGLGLAASSYFFWGNLAIQNFGAAPLAIHVGHRAKVGLSTKQALETWAWAYKRGAKHMGISGAVAGVSVLIAGIRIASVTSNAVPLTRNFLLGLSAVLLFPAPWTFGLMLPINNRLLSILDESNASSTAKASGLTVSQENEIEDLLQKWQNMHYTTSILSNPKTRQMLRPTLGNTIGGLLLGTVGALFGALAVQGYIYYINYKKDWKFQKIALAFDVHAVYWYLVIKFGNAPAQTLLVWLTTEVPAEQDVQGIPLSLAFMRARDGRNNFADFPWTPQLQTALDIVRLTHMETLNARKAARDQESSMFDVSKALQFKTSSQGEDTGSINHASKEESGSIISKHAEEHIIRHGCLEETGTAV
ncbi:hypothetical protein D9619_006878 [Psilocybe cf. subviscida]|uniref:Uncharacterized protein n=1 Tax=Psilocybe cf. subviscida TaxID=2480587 RepID=A0A8H5B513_9AGAR|nr:hypothetical protein D9619_006878 [Psilocybe cf. subviscida]